MALDHNSSLADKFGDLLARTRNAIKKSEAGGLIPRIAQEFLGGGDAGNAPELVSILRDLFTDNKLNLPLDSDSAGDFKPEFATQAKNVLSGILTAAGKPGLAFATREAIDILKKRIAACGADPNSTHVPGLPVEVEHDQDVILYFVERDGQKNPILPEVEGSTKIAFGTLQRGFLQWAMRLDMVVRLTTQHELANLIVTGENLGENTSILARTDIGPPHGRQLRMVFNTAKKFTRDLFESNVAHEFGHALGIFHEDVVQDDTQVMNSMLLGVKEPLPPDTPPNTPPRMTDLGAAIFRGWKLPSP
jgi:hypothetical protein